MIASPKPYVRGGADKAEMPLNLANQQVESGYNRDAALNSRRLVDDSETRLLDGYGHIWILPALMLAHKATAAMRLPGTTDKMNRPVIL